MKWSIRIRLLVVERGLLDTSVVVDLEKCDPSVLPGTFAISAITLAELSAGPAAAKSDRERARRQNRLQQVEATLDAIPFDGSCARAYGQVYAAVAARGRSARSRVADLQIAATALALGLPLFTRNAADLQGLEDLIDIVEVSA